MVVVDGGGSARERGCLCDTHGTEDGLRAVMVITNQIG